jgi:hypothetical protein
MCRPVAAEDLGETEDEFGTASDDAMELVSRDLGFQILDKVKADPNADRQDDHRHRPGQGRRRPLLQGRAQALDGPRRIAS